MTTRIVTGNILKPDGTPFVGKYAAIFTLLTEIYSGGTVYPEDNIHVTTDATGAFSVDLAVPDTGTAPYRVAFADGFSTDFNLAAGASTDLGTLITIPVSPNLPNALDALMLDIPTKGLGLSKNVVRAWDDFDAADGLLHGRVTPSGHTWACMGTGGSIPSVASITSKRYTAVDNSYAQLDYGIPIVSFGGNFSFMPGASTEIYDGAILTIATLGAIGNLNNLIHVNFGAGSWVILKRVSGGAFVYLTQGYYNLSRDGTVYSIRMDIVGTLVTIYLPDGKVASYTDADFATMPHSCAFWQIGGSSPTLCPVGRWESAWIGEPAIQKSNPSAFAPLQEMGILRGSGLTRMQHLKVTLASGTGWYRIANCVPMGTYVMMGKVKLTAIDTINQWMTVWEFDVKGYTGAAPVLINDYRCDYGACIDQVRLSNDDAGSLIGLDVHVHAACTTDPATLYVDFYGYFTPVILPVVGATALATANVVINMADPSDIITYATDRVGIRESVPEATLDIFPVDASVPGLKLRYFRNTTDGDGVILSFAGDVGTSLSEIQSIRNAVTSGFDIVFLTTSWGGGLLEKLRLKHGGDAAITGNADVSGVYKVDGVQVITNRVIDARCDDAINSGDGTTDGVIDALRDAMIAHGLIAAA